MGNGNAQDGSGIPKSATVKVDERSEASEIFDAALAEYNEKTKGEAGRTEGRIFPELEVGAQVYPDPRTWGPDTGGVSLTLDENYGRVTRILDRIDREDGFDGRS